MDKKYIRYYWTLLQLEEKRLLENMATAVGFPGSGALSLSYLQWRGSLVLCGCDQVVILYQAGGHGFVQKGLFCLALAKCWH